MGNTNTNWTAMSDGAIIKAIGAYVRHQRLSQNKTQAQVAKEAGINRWTLSQFENGESITFLSFIQILRSLDLLHLFEAYKIKTQVSPIELAKLEQKKRRRASNKKESDQSENDW